jgi:hypothetical protein
MHPKTSARLLSILNWAIAIVGYPLLCVLLLGWLAGERSILPLLVFSIAWALFPKAALSIPVRCNLPGCLGQMKMTGDWAIDWKSRIKYQCTICQSIYETDVYHPPFHIYSIRFGVDEDWSN